MTLLDLPDGRVLDVEVSGPDDGTVMLFHHGTPGSGLQRRALQDACAERGLRLVTYSRPGYGGSTRRPGRTVADIAEDMAVLLDSLGAQRCFVGGWSGGGPHSLATAALLPDRVRAAVTVAGVGPYRMDGLQFLDGMGEQNIVEFHAAVEGEQALRTLLEREAAELREVDARSVVAALDSLLPEVDRAVLDEEFGEGLVRSFHYGLKDGIDGWVDDDLAFTRPWGFELDSIRVPVFVWQGSADLMVPFAHGQWLAAHVPGAVAHLEEGQGHLSIELGSLGRTLDELLATPE